MVRDPADFRDDLDLSLDRRLRSWWDAVYADVWPDLVRVRVHTYEDDQALQRAGVDVTLELTAGWPVRIDEKVHRRYYHNQVLEIDHIDHAGRVVGQGWLTKPGALTDLVAYGFPRERHVAFHSFRLLQQAWEDHRREWTALADRRAYGFQRADGRNVDYITRCIAVPEKILLEATGGFTWP